MSSRSKCNAVVREIRSMKNTIVNVIESAKDDIIGEVQKLDLPLFQSTENGRVNSDADVASSILKTLFSTVTPSTQSSTNNPTELGPMTMQDLNVSNGNTGCGDSTQSSSINPTELGPMTIQDLNVSNGNTGCGDSPKLSDIASHSPYADKNGTPVVYVVNGGKQKHSHKPTKRVRFRQSIRKRPTISTRRKRR